MNVSTDKVICALSMDETDARRQGSKHSGDDKYILGVGQDDLGQNSSHRSIQ